MALPNYEGFMLPLMKVLQTSEVELSRQELYVKVADYMQLSADDRAARYSRTTNSLIFSDRISWAMTYLKFAELIDNVRRGYYKITRRGLDLLKTNPTELSQKILMQYPEFREFNVKKNSKDTSQNPISPLLNNATEIAIVEETTQTPQELLQESYLKLRAQLAVELLEKVKNNTPQFFEKLVVDLLVSMGYGGNQLDAGRAIGQSGDGGIDGIINEDRLGLDVVYIQAKRWKDKVSSPTVRDFVGSLEGQRANKGVIITTSSYTPDALKYVTTIGKKVVLIDGEQLANFMIDFNVGVGVAETYVIKRVDSDYFEET